MSQLHVGNQQFFRQYSPDSELPLENRVFTTEYEQARRQRGFGQEKADFSSPMQFDISMNNELYFLRSCNLRLPITAAFVDEFGNQVRSPEEVACLALRNRPERAFNQIETNLNGFRSNRRPDDQSWEEYLVTDDEYGLNLPNEGVGVPINTVQLSSAPRVGTQQIATLDSQAVQRIPSEENPNYAARARTFADSWNYDKAEWEGNITIPLECGAHRPWSSKKAVRTKFVPFIGTEQIRYNWKQARAQFDSGLADDHMSVAKYLFEQSTRLHQSARDTPIARQVCETDSFSLWLEYDKAFLIIPHDNAPSMGQEQSGLRTHADVCARYPPGSTLEFDAVTMALRGKVALQTSFSADYFDKPYKVFRVQDCSLGAVGGMFGRTGSVSASTNVAAVSSASGSAKYGAYKAFLNVDGGPGNARFNATRRNALFPDSFQPWPVPGPQKRPSLEGYFASVQVL